MVSPLLNTKLYLPTPRSGMVLRPRLLDRLDEGLYLDRGLTLVSAPAGYGKSMLVTEWLHHLSALPEKSWQMSWLSLDENDNDPSRFMAYFLAAVEKLGTSAGASLLSLMSSPGLPPVEMLMTALINEMSETGDPAGGEGRANAGKILVLDDYHKIRHAFIHDAVQFFLDHRPPQFHLVISTREDPPLQLARRRVAGEMSELRSHDLRFTSDEIGTLFNRTMGLGLKPEWIEALASRTEGWIAGLQLAALSLQGRADIDLFLEDFHGSHRYVIDYLMDEVLRLQSEDVRSFLFATSILDRFNAALADAVTDRQDSPRLDSRQQIAQLEAANLFLIPLDERREWYRYHHLFSDFLQVSLDERLKLELHQKASAWFEANGHPPEAIQHALQAEDYPRAAELIQRFASQWIGYGQLVTFLGWIEALPEWFLQQHPDLLSYKAWVLYFTGQFEAAQRLMQSLSQADPHKIGPLAQGRLLSLQAWNANAREDPDTVSLAEAGLALIGDSDPLLRATTLLPLGHGYRRGNDWPAAARAYRESVEAGRKSGAYLAIVSPINSLAVTLAEMGRRLEAEDLCRQTRGELTDRRGNPLPIVDLLSISEAVITYEGNQLAAALEHGKRGREAGERFLSGRLMGGEVERVLIRTYAALGEPDAAMQIIAETRAGGMHLKWVKPMIDALEAELCMKLGRLDEAAHWAAALDIDPSRPPIPARELVYTTYARLLLRTGRPAEARALLEGLEPRIQAGGRSTRWITLHLLWALAEMDLGQTAAAFRRLEAAAMLAAPHGYLRRFLDEGPSVQAMLAAYQQAARPPSAVRQPADKQPAGKQPADKQPANGQMNAEARAFLHAVENAFVTDRLAAAAPDEVQPAKTTGRTASESAGLIDPLSDQELKVLRLLSAGLSNGEVAAELVISVGTAKWHAHNIYTKLGVSSRTQAVARAQELNLLS